MPLAAGFHPQQSEVQVEIPSDLLNTAFSFRRAGSTGGTTAAAGFPRLEILTLFINYKHGISEYDNTNYNSSHKTLHSQKV